MEKNQTKVPQQAHRFCVAPMMDWTDRHARFFLRLISRRAFLYTEMVTTGALLHSKDPKRFLAHNHSEHPLALQLGGSDPTDLAKCAKMAVAFGYDEVNLNCGCPSDRVQSGRFGACLMAEPDLVADCLAALSESGLPATLKTRIGLDHREDYDFIATLVEKARAAGTQTVILHARKAWLTGLNPRQNREVPPLHYDVVHHIKQDFPDLTIILNGGLTTLADCAEQLKHVDGVMMGREAYQNPWILAEVDRQIFADDSPARERAEIITPLYSYASQQVAEGAPIQALTRHILGLFNGVRGARAWRRYLSKESFKPGASAEVITDAYRAFTQAQ